MVKTYADSGKKRHMKPNSLREKTQISEDRRLLVNRKLS